MAIRSVGPWSTPQPIEPKTHSSSHRIDPTNATMPARNRHARAAPARAAARLISAMISDSSVERSLTWAEMRPSSAFRVRPNCSPRLRGGEFALLPESALSPESALLPVDGD